VRWLVALVALACALALFAKPTPPPQKPVDPAELNMLFSGSWAPMYRL